MDLAAVARHRMRRVGEDSASGRTRTTEEDEEDEDDLDSEEAKALVRDFIKHALDGVRGGQRAQYYELLEALTGLEEPSVAQDKILMLTALVECVSSLDERLHESLLQRLLSVSLWRCGREVGALVVEFCVNLVSTHTGSLLHAVLDVLVQAFAPPPGYDLDALDAAEARERKGGWGAREDHPPPVPSTHHHHHHPFGGSGSLTGGRDALDAAATHSVVAAVASEAAMKAPGALDAPSPPSPAHVSASATRAVEHILVLVPLAATVLRPVLLARIPHATAPKPIQTWYLRNAFRLVESDAGACLRDPLLAGVVKHMLEMDVEIKWEDIRAPRRGDDGDEGASSASDDPDESDVDDDLDDDDDEANDDTGEGRGGGIFELEDIERTIEEQLVAQAAAWERGDARGGHGGHHHFQSRGRGRARGHRHSPATSGENDAAPRAAPVDETADTLDSMMELAIAHVDARMDRLADGDAAKAALFDAFCSTLLPAHRSKFVQFLVFHACAKDAAARVASVDKTHPRSYDEVLRFGGTLNHHASGGTNDAPFPGPTHGGGPFGAAPRASAPDETLTGSLAARVADALVARLTDPHHPPAGRLAAAAYLASFLARAAFLPPAFLAATLRRLSDWCAATAASAGGGPGGGFDEVAATFSAGAPLEDASGASAPGASASGMGVKRASSGQLTRGFGSSFRIADGSDSHGSLSGSESGAEARDVAGADPGKKSGVGSGGTTLRDPADAAASASASAEASAATLAIFDSACQALMYVLCYRMEDVLRRGGEPAAAVRALPLRRVLYSRLQPTRACLPSVVSEFLRRASEAGLDGFDAAFVRRALREREEAEDPRKGKGKDPKQQAPPGGASSLGGDVAEAVRRRRPLRMFFPFDPYLLRRSAALLRLHVTYAEWKGGTSANGTGREATADDDDLDLDMDGGASGSDGSRGLEPSDSSSDEASHGGRADSGSRGTAALGASAGRHGSPLNSIGSLPNSFNPRPRKLTRGLLGPQPLFGGGAFSGSGRKKSVSPGTSASPGANPAGSTMEHALGGFARFGGGSNAPAPLVGFGGSNGGFGVGGGGAGSAEPGSPSGGSPAGAFASRGSPHSPSRLGASPGANAGGGHEVERRTAARQTGRARGTPPRYPKRGDRDPGRGK